MATSTDPTGAEALELAVERTGRTTAIRLALPVGVRREADVLHFALEGDGASYVVAPGGLRRAPEDGVELVPGAAQELLVEVRELRGTVTAWVVVFDAGGGKVRTLRQRARRGLMRLDLGEGRPGEVASFALRLSGTGLVGLGGLRLLTRPEFRLPSPTTCPPPTTSSSSSR